MEDLQFLVEWSAVWTKISKMHFSATALRLSDTINLDPLGDQRTHRIFYRTFKPISKHDALIEQVTKGGHRQEKTECNSFYLTLILYENLAREVNVDWSMF